MSNKIRRSVLRHSVALNCYWKQLGLVFHLWRRQRLIILQIHWHAAHMKKSWLRDKIPGWKLFPPWEFLAFISESICKNIKTLPVVERDEKQGGVKGWGVVAGNTALLLGGVKQWESESSAVFGWHAQARASPGLWDIPSGSPVGGWTLIQRSRSHGGGEVIS